jgi:LPXTG-site transpeptidase (sortase) family protein
VQNSSGKMPKSKKGAAKNLKSKSSFLETIKSMVSRVNFRQFIGVFFLILGFILTIIAPDLAVPKFQDNKEPIVASESFKKDDKKLSVVRILLPKENIDLPVKPSKLVSGYWETAENGASQGEGTANPGTGGNVVIFAHAREGMFYNLRDVKRGEIIYVFTKDKWYRYKVSNVQTVYPKDVAKVAPTKTEELTLFTCSGFFDEKRLIVKALPIK